MNIHEINAPDAPAANGYAQAMVVPGPARILFISGQIPADREGNLPESFEDQARQCWANLFAQLRAGGMTVDNLVKVTVFLADASLVPANRVVRAEMLAGKHMALSTVIAGLVDDRWFLEIEAVAAA
jgi:enamine deaminase RidA (YjgF/YER057c/UK114 family)